MGGHDWLEREEPLHSTVPRPFVQYDEHPGYAGDDPDAHLPGPGLNPASAHDAFGYLFDQPVNTSAPATPTSLDPSAAPPPPAIDHGPLDKNAAKRITNAGDAHRLLTSKDGDPSGEKATHAVDLLLEIAPEQRGAAIDQMDEKAFRRMLERVPADQRERFSGLLAGTKRADRKLHLWKESHLSRARNDVERQKGDAGVDDPKTERTIDRWTSDLSKKDQAKDDRKYNKKHRDELSDEANDERDGKRSRKQKDNLAYHQRHVERYAHTQAEVKDEVGDLYGADGSMPELKDVDAMIERKELEYSIEKKTNLDLTNDIGGGERERKWAKDELETVDLTIMRLPRDYLDRPDGLHEIARTTHPRSGVGGFHSDHRIGMTDPGVAADPKYGHAGQKREGTSADFNAKHGDTIGNLESALTHEIGHDVADRNPAAFEAFKQAAGYRSYDRKELAADDMSPDAIATLDRARDGGTTDSNPGIQRRYSPQFGTDQYWGVDHTAVPYSDNAETGPNKGTWQYARHSPSEHFAEHYQKAVHAPKKLHEDLVEHPAAEAKVARGEVSVLLTAMNDLPDTPANAGKLADLQQELDEKRARMEEKQRAVEQRRKQFEVMRNDVFGTDKATASARGRLGVTLDANRLAAFDKEAAALSTPEQIKTLEERYRL